MPGEQITIDPTNYPELAKIEDGEQVELKVVGTKSSDEDGQITEAHSISAGLDYPGIGPEHSWLKDSGRVEYVPIMDQEALEAFQLLTKLEGIIPALEPAHAIAAVTKVAPTMDRDAIILANLCGRGDKDIFTVGKILGVEL